MRYGRLEVLNRVEDPDHVLVGLTPGEPHTAAPETRLELFANESAFLTP